MNSAQAWQIVLDRMKLANPGWVKRAEAEHLLNEYFDRRKQSVRDPQDRGPDDGGLRRGRASKPYWSIIKGA
jgi:hypothetical protein